jgi:hypothetical protein
MKSQPTVREVKSDSPFASVAKGGFHFKLSTMLVMIAIFAAVSATLIWASRLPIIHNDIHAILGTKPSVNSDGTDRGTHLIFLLLCYSAPLGMACVIRLFMLFAIWLQSRVATIESDDRDDLYRMEQ